MRLWNIETSTKQTQNIEKMKLCLKKHQKNRQSQSLDNRSTNLGQSKYQFNQLILINHKKKFSIK